MRNLPSNREMRACRQGKWAIEYGTTVGMAACSFQSHLPCSAEPHGHLGRCLLSLPVSNITRYLPSENPSKNHGTLRPRLVGRLSHRGLTRHPSCVARMRRPGKVLIRATRQVRTLLTSAHGAHCRVQGGLPILLEGCRWDELQASQLGRTGLTLLVRPGHLFGPLLHRVLDLVHLVKEYCIWIVFGGERGGAVLVDSRQNGSCQN